MKRALLTIALVSWCTAQADHNSPVGSTALLSYEAQELQEAVQYTNLSYQVKQAVYNFNYRVNALVDCVRYNGRNVLNDHTEEPGCPSECVYQLRSVESSFRPVERFLYDTQWDYPNVYHAYVGVRRALRAISISGNPGPGPGTGLVSCTAVDNGWEEHFGGHVGYGNSVGQAQRAALIDCQRVHGNCRIQSCRQQ